MEVSPEAERVLLDLHDKATKLWFKIGGDLQYVDAGRGAFAEGLFAGMSFLNGPTIKPAYEGTLRQVMYEHGNVIGRAICRRVNSC